MDIFVGFILVIIVLGIGYIIYSIIESNNNTKEVIEEYKNDREKILLKKMEIEQKVANLRIENSKLSIELEKLKRGKQNGPISKCNSKSKKRNVGRAGKSLCKDKK